jgi:hypothetical protein
MSKTQFINPINGKKHRKWSAMHRAIGQSIGRATRDNFDAVSYFGKQPGAIYSRTIISLFSPALDGEYVEFDNKGRGSALNHDMYGYDPSQGVAVIQARQAFRRAKNHYLNVRKTYFLVGRNEITGKYFRHPVGSHAVRATIRVDPDPAAVVRAVQRWMWEVTDRQLSASVRQGDVLLVPEKRIPKTESLGTTYLVADSHHISADEIRINGRVYACNPSIVHTKGQHAPVAMTGWCSIRTARDVSAWDFAARIGD